MPQIRAIQLACLSRQATGQVRVTNDGYAIAHHDLPRLGELTVTTLFGGKIDNHAAVSHRANHFCSDEFRRRLAGNQRRRDNDVNFLRLLRKQCHFGFDELLAHRFRVTAFAGTVFIIKIE